MNTRKEEKIIKIQMRQGASGIFAVFFCQTPCNHEKITV